MKSYNFAHLIWKAVVKEGDILIDATIGNGHDTLLMAKLLKGKGAIFGYDIQKKALENTQALLEKNLTFEEKKIVTLRFASHETFFEKEAKLIAYNLGYLPQGDKALTTLPQTTLKSLQSAMNLISCDGLISIMCYVGHENGKKEYEALKSFLSDAPKEFRVSKIMPLNRAEAPILFLVQKENGHKEP